MAQDCGPLQFLREFTQNGLEAIGERRGEIVWAEDTWSEPAGACDGRKLCIYDTGTGMTAEELDLLIGNLFSSGRTQGLDANYGVGAKISSLAGNPFGVVYTTLKDGVATQMHLHRSVMGVWARKTNASGSTTWDATGQLPPAVQEAGHGTMVSFLGAAPEADTVSRPESSEEAPTAWLVKWLNARYFQLPPNVTLRARRLEGKDQSARTIQGQRILLDSSSTDRGALQIAGGTAMAYWWVIDERRSKANASYGNVNGHVGVVHNDEMYEVSRPGTSSYSHLRTCGVTFGCKNVVVYFKLLPPFVSQVVPDTARTRLIHRNQEFPLGELEVEFARNLPNEIKAHVERAAPTSDDQARSTSVRKNLESVLQRLGFERYRPSASAAALADDEPVPGALPKSAGGRGSTGSAPPGGPGGRDGSGYLRPGDRVSGMRVAGLNLPQVQWVNAADGSREPDEMEDRAALYVQHKNLILVNADFRGFTSLEQYWLRQLDGVLGAPEAIRTALRNEVDLTLTEAVASIIYFKQDKGTWKTTDRDNALSPEALTTVAMQRFRFDQAIAKATRSLKQAPREDL